MVVLLTWNSKIVDQQFASRFIYVLSQKIVFFDATLMIGVLKYFDMSL